MSAVFPRPIKELLYDFDVAFSGELLAHTPTPDKFFCLNELLQAVVALSAHIRVELVLLSVVPKVPKWKDVMSGRNLLLITARTGKPAWLVRAFRFMFHQTTALALPPFPLAHTCRTVRVERERVPL